MNRTTRTFTWLVVALLALTGLAETVDAQREGRPDGPRDAQRSPGPKGDDRERGPRDHRRSDRLSELTEARIDNIMTVISAHAPEYAVQLASLRTENPAKFRMLLQRLRPRFEGALRLYESDPEAFELHARQMRLNMKIAHAVRAYRAAEADEDKTARRADLRELIDDRFTLQIEQAEREVIAIERRLDRLRTEIAERETHRDQRVDESLKALLAKTWKPDRYRGDGPDGPGAPGGPRADRRDRPGGPQDPGDRTRPDRPDDFDRPPPPDAPSDQPERP